MLIQEPVKAAIWHCLNHYDYKDAVFLAERLCAEVETDESIFILATSYFRSQQIQQAFWLLKEKSRRSPHCRYLLAKCAYQLKYYAEAESALSSCNFGELKHFDEITKEFGEIACFAIYLIAQICIKTERTKIATDALHVALKLNPFLWHAFTELCLLDEQIDISNIFNVKNDNVFKTCQSNVNFMHTSIIFPNELNTTTSSTATTTDINNEVIFINNQQQQQQLLKSNNKKGKIITRALYDSLLLKTPTPTTTTTGGIGAAAAVATTTNMDMFQTPNNLNSSLNLLLGKTDNWDDTPLSIMQSTPPPPQQQQQQHDVAKLQAAHTLAHMDEFAGTNQQDAANISMNDTTTLLDTPFKRNFKYLQSSCPLTPSFGVLPFSPDMTAESPLIGANATTMTLNMNTPTPTPTTTTSIDLPKEQNKQRRQLNRDGIAYALALNSNNNNNNNSNNNNNAMRGGNNNNNSSTPALSQTTANRQSTNVTMMTTTTITAAPATTTTTPVQQQQAQFFTPTTFRTPVNVANNNNNNNNNNVATGNNNNNMNLPSTNNTTNTNNNNNNNNSAAVRRSSRLFGNNVGNSVKENSKTPPNIGGHSKFAAPRSPPRKTKPRIPKICLNNELIEEKFTTENKKIENQTTNKIDKRKLDKIAGKLTQQQQEQSEQKRANAVRAAIIASVTTQQQQQQNKNLTTCIENNVNSINNINTAQTLTHEILKCKKQSAEGLMSLLRELGMGYKLLFTYNCKKALKHFETQIPNHHFNSCWLQSLIGVAHYELRQYEDAIKIFKAIREIEPYRLEYMEFYSSSLWHLQRDVEMSALAHDLINLNKLSPVTWCVAGNCFSLHKEHETAIKFFKRAVQIDPDFVYSYTLLGHELLLAEDLDKAMDYFRYAIMRDPRHYYAWFGMGTIYSKQEKYELAELHYMRALKINPQNSVILVHIGAMQYFMGKKDKALTTLNAAALLEPRDPLSRFHRASIYFSLGRHQEALDELEELKKLVPKESVVFYLIGKIHKQLGNADLALMHFSWATDLDPKGANNQIKDVFDSMAPQNCCSNIGDEIIEEAVSEGSEDSTQAHPELNYDSDVY